MGVLEVQQLIHRCAQDGLVNPYVITISPATISQRIQATVKTVQQEQIDLLLATTEDLMNFPTADEAIVISIGICEQLNQVEPHLCRWFLDLLLRDAAPELRQEMARSLSHTPSQPLS